MNWMIDGACGDLYRQAMDYPAELPARDEWEAERAIGRRTWSYRRLAAGLARYLAARAAQLREILHLAPTPREIVS